MRSIQLQSSFARAEHECGRQCVCVWVPRLASHLPADGMRTVEKETSRNHTIGIFNKLKLKPLQNLINSTNKWMIHESNGKRQIIIFVHALARSFGSPVWEMRCMNAGNQKISRWKCAQPRRATWCEEASGGQLPLYIISCINLDFPHAHTLTFARIKRSTSNLSLSRLCGNAFPSTSSSRSYEHNIQINCLCYIYLPPNHRTVGKTGFVRMNRTHSLPSHKYTCTVKPSTKLMPNKHHLNSFNSTLNRIVCVSVCAPKNWQRRKVFACAYRNTLCRQHNSNCSMLSSPEQLGSERTAPFPRRFRFSFSYVSHAMICVLCWPIILLLLSPSSSSSSQLSST